MKDTTKKEKEQLKKEFEEKFDTLYEAGGFHDDYEDVTKELWTWFESQIDRIRGDSVRGFEEKIFFGETIRVDDKNYVSMEHIQNVLKEYLNSKSGGIKE